MDVTFPDNNPNGRPCSEEILAANACYRSHTAAPKPYPWCSSPAWGNGCSCMDEGNTQNNHVVEGQEGTATARQSISCALLETAEREQLSAKC